MSGPPSYHDLYVTTPDIPRTRLFDLPYGLAVICTRVSGWELWRMDGAEVASWKHLAAGRSAGGEYDSDWLLLDVGGHVIVDSRPRYLPDGDDPGRHRHPLAGPGWSEHEHPGGPHWHDPESLLQVPIAEGER